MRSGRKKVGSISEGENFKATVLEPAGLAESANVTFDRVEATLASRDELGV